MSKTKQIIAAILAILGIGGGVVYSQLGSVGGLPAEVADVRTVSVGQQGNVLIFEPVATSTTCSSRLIGNPGKALWLKFATTAEAAAGTGEVKGFPRLDINAGYVIAASSTTVLDAETFGCGFVAARAEGATSTIQVVEFR